MDAISSTPAATPPTPQAASPSPAASPARSAAGGVAPNPGRPGGATSEQLKQAVDRINRELQQSNRELAFVFDDKLHRMLVKIVDTQTNTVVRQVPSEDMLAMARALQDAPARGALIKSRA